LSYVGINSVGLRRRGFTTEKLERFRISIEYYIKKITIPLKL
jgi:acyl-[acyl carrier protein]--UDP-N-acetylglucosamine O-acyltransferase